MVYLKWFIGISVSLILSSRSHESFLSSIAILLAKKVKNHGIYGICFFRYVMLIDQMENSPKDS